MLKRWGGMVLLAGVLFGGVALDAQAEGASKKAAAEEEAPLPDGCFKTWLCYKPPAKEEVNPVLEEKKFQVYLAEVFLGFPFVQWVLPDDAKRPATDEDLMDHLKATFFPLLVIMPVYVVSLLLMYTIILLPFGLIGAMGSLVALYAYSFWIGPITHIHLVNRSLMRDQKAGGKTKKKAATAADLDDEE